MGLIENAFNAQVKVYEVYKYKTLDDFKKFQPLLSFDKNHRLSTATIKITDVNEIVYDHRPIYFEYDYQTQKLSVSLNDREWSHLVDRLIFIIATVECNDDIYKWKHQIIEFFDKINEEQNSNSIAL